MSRPAAAARRRAGLEAAVADAEGHGLHRGQARRGAGDRAGARRAADAARHALLLVADATGRQHLFQLPGSEPHLLAPGPAAAGKEKRLPLVTRFSAAVSAWLSPAYGAAPLRLVPDLDRIEALAPERDALWARLDKSTFLTPNEKRLAAGYPALDGGDGLTHKFNPNHDALGRFTFGPGGDWRSPDGTLVDPANARPQIRVNVRGRDYVVASKIQETELILAADRAKQAMDAVARLDPSWRPTPSLSDPVTAEGAIAAFRAEAQEAEARITFFQRGGVPLGFASRQDFEAFGRTAWDGLAAAGYRDAEPFLRGSSVTGYSFSQGNPFDQGRTSDYDFAVASPSLMSRARELGLPLRGGGTRTAPINDTSTLEMLGLGDVMTNLRLQSGRDMSIVIFGSRDALTQRGPNTPLP